MINNMGLSPAKSGKTIEKDILSNNVRVHDRWDDTSGTSADSLSYLSTGGITVDIVRGILLYLKEEVKEKLFLISKTGGKNNKQTTETLNDNIEAYSYTWIRKTILSEEIARFYWKILDLSQKCNFAQVGKLPKFLKGNMQFTRPLEILLNLTAEGKEKDHITQEYIQRQENNDGAKNGG